jgi:acetyltransferase
MKSTIVSLPLKSQATVSPRLGTFPDCASIEQLVTVKGHGKMKLRPIRIEDEQEMIRFHSSISEESIYMRYFEYLDLDQRTSHDRLIRICTNTPESYAVVMEAAGTLSHHEAILAVGRLTTTPERSVVTFDTLMTNQKTPSPLAKVLLKRLIKLAHTFGFKIMTGDLLIADHDALNLCRALGFAVQTLPEGGVIRVTYDLAIAPAKRG